MSKVTVTTTAPLAAVLCSSASTITITFTMAPTSVGLIAVLGQHEVILPPVLILRGTLRSVAGLVTVPQQQPQSEMLSWAIIGPPQVSFFLEWSLPLIFLY